MAKVGVEPEEAPLEAPASGEVKEVVIGATGEEKGDHDHPEPGSPEYFRYLTKAIFAVGLSKCITPAVLILMGIIFLAVDVPETAQDCLEQIAGGLLIYTWGAKCMVPIQESFVAAFKESKAHSKTVVAVVSLSMVLVLILAPFFYLGTEGHDFSKVDGGIVMFGIMQKGEKVQCNADGTAVANATRVCHQKPTRPGLVHSTKCHNDANSSEGGSMGAAALIPYFIGFALDAIMLVLVEPEEELVETYTKMRQSFKSQAKDLLVAPIAFALDNLLTGAGAATVVMAAAAGSKGVSVIYFIIFALCTVVGVVVAFSIRAFMELCNNKGVPAVGLWFKFAFLLAAALSFLDNGADLVKTGLTFWVGIGCAIGWMLFAMELLDGGDEEEE